MAEKPHLQSVNDHNYVGEVSAPPTPPTTGGPPNGNGAPPPAPNRAASRQRAERNLPTDRLGFEKQTQALQAIAQISGPGKRPVSSEEISAFLGLKGNTGGLSNKFFADTGWVVRQGRAAYVATDELLTFHRHLGMDPEDLAGAKRHLIVPATSSWYWQEIKSMVAGQGMRESGILFTLAKAAGASNDHREQLQLIVEWLIWLGLVRREGDAIVAADPVTNDDSEPDLDLDPESAAESSVEHDELVQNGTVPESYAEEPTRKAAVTGAVDEAMISMSISVRITHDDVANMSDERLASVLAFMERMKG